MHRSLALIALFGMTTIANAQPNAPQQVKTFTLSVTGDELNILGEALGTLPYGKVAPLMQKLQMQIAEQQKTQSTPPQTPKVEPPK